MRNKLRLLAALLIFTYCTAFAQQATVSASFPFGNCPPAQVDFNVSPAIGYTYDWYFSDGTQFTTTTPNTSHTFSNPGYNYASVSIYDANGSYIINTYVYVDIAGISNIYMNPNDKKVCPGDQIEIYVPFNNNSGGANFSWDFGDGTTQTGSSSSGNHTYSAAGDYTVTVTAQFQGCPTTTVTDTVHVQNGLPVSSGQGPTGGFYFDLNPDSVCIGDPVQANFQNYIYNHYFIDYGDGYTSSSNTSHSYSFNGKYYAALTVTNGCGNSATKYDSVIVASGIGITYAPYFYPSSYDNCPNSSVYFWAPSGFSNYSWNLGNGNSSTVSNPNTTYPNIGNYAVTLQVTNGCGATNYRTDTIHIVNNIPISSVSLNMPDTICPGTPALVNVYANGANNYSVNFSPGQNIFTPNGGLSSGNNGGGGGNSSASGIYTYTTPGTYTVTATATNGCGNSGTSTQVVEVYNGAPLDANSFQFMGPDEACVTDTAYVIVGPSTIGAFSINFGDGSPLATTPSFTITANEGINYAIFKHKYPGVGSYQATATITNNCGNSATQIANVNMTNGAKIDAGFLFDNTKYLCMQDEIEFTGFGASKYTFDFGDQSPLITSTDAFPKIRHKFPWAGLYKVKVYAENGCGAKDTSIQDISIEYSPIYITTNSINSPTCHQQKGKAIASVNYGANPPYTFSWTNGDHSAIADSLYAGIYEVTVTDSKGCSSRAISTVSDAQAPTIAVANNIPVTCFGGNDGAIALNIIGGSAPYTFTWSNGLSTQNINNLVAGPYEVTVQDASGCVSTKSVLINSLTQGFNTTFQITSASCNSSNGSINAVVSPNNYNYNYVWSNGISTAANSNIGAGVYHLTVIDYNGCINDYDVTVNNTGGPSVAVDSISSVNCLGNGNEIYVSSFPTPTQPGPFTYNWMPGNASTANLIGVGSGSYTLTVTGSGNCKSYQTVNIGDATMMENPICLVTVDTTTTTNKVVWEEVTQPNLASYNVYRESSQAGLYYLVGNVDKDSLHQFIDPVADPSIRGWRYKISTVSTCGVESARSVEHKTIHLTINKGLGNAYNLIWDNYIGQVVPTFYIWRYTNVAGWVKIDSIPSNLFSYTDLNAPSVASASDLSYMVEGGPLTSCDPTRAAINTSRSNIKNARQANPTGIKSYTNESVLIYPNPSSGQFTINTGSALEAKAELRVLNNLGETVYTEQLMRSATATTIDLSAFDNGVYFVKMILNDQLVVKRIVLTK
ncbi:MAG: PKD domain-containing protein [Bacteroidia bacterium]